MCFWLSSNLLILWARDQVDMNGPRNRPPTFVTFGAMNPYYFTSDWCLTYNPQVAIPAGFANKVLGTYT